MHAALVLVLCVLGCAERTPGAHSESDAESGADTVDTEPPGPDTGHPDTGGWPNRIEPCLQGYADDDGDGYPGRRCADDGHGLSRLIGTDCDDDDGAVHPGATEICGDAADDDCDGRALSCSWQPDGTIATAGFELEGQEENEWIGTSIARVDAGFSEAPVVAIAAYLHNYENGNEGHSADGVHGYGKVWFFDMGQHNVDLDASVATLVPPFGASAWEVRGSLGDLTGDGASDLLIKVSDDTGGGFALYAGPFRDNVYFDSNVALLTGVDDPVTAGDWNGDGVADIAAWSDGLGVWASPLNGSLTSSDALSMLVADDELSPAFASPARDFDGDGRPDLAVAAASAGDPTAADAVAIVPSGLTGTFTLPDAATAIVRGTSRLEMLGEVIDAAGDVNGDGYQDVVAGCHFVETSQPDGAFILFGPWQGESMDRDHSAAFVNSEPSFDGPGDFDGDGVDDLALGGFWGTNPSGQGSGAVQIFEGPLEEGTYDLTSIRGDVVLWAPDGVGVGAATPVGDVDGDGRADLAIEASDDDPIKGAGGVYFVFGGAL